MARSRVARGDSSSASCGGCCCCSSESEAWRVEMARLMAFRLWRRRSASVASSMTAGLMLGIAAR